MLKLGVDAPGSFLFESIAGGERLGRYSFIGLSPQVWFRISDGVAETSSTPDFADAKPLDGTPVASLRHFVETAKAETAEDLPPMASGAFGYVGYDMIQHV
ncbi:MAG: anthranilate synthase component I, partial [Novosphingobium sp.]|nr:anthranilate synthase component I [Novosphingobium sp.]